MAPTRLSRAPQAAKLRQKARLPSVASRANLICIPKITGSQRIGLFGAQKDDLPEIWRQLIEAGFETGHAYAKALRMAKTCVGSTRCRYGVGDSVGFGVELENRYKGIRTPHKNEVRRLRLYP